MTTQIDQSKARRNRLGRELGRRIVRPATGGWAVYVPGATKASFVEARRGDAIARARRTLRNEGGGTVEVCDAEGTVVEAIEVRRRVRGATTLSPGA